MSETVAFTASVEKILRDVDEALSKYGQAFTTSQMPETFERAATFEQARLALRRARDQLADLRCDA